ncbi:hypothetical protein HFO33_34235 [Rhizobium leguminosarum]|uniref:hypothetical protein n=1 Tax=Rhizobium leguminosarum TaxID=384 RepID=UPI001C948AAB|nr:hypothetical protein [Rhizobium leguminosarum]MBY5667389.1 hypothetical protein [Rhizobium leguminosarum]MBY5710105.1 hypothetical protein [Rhizobium leguminosarum]MBY5721557.1 hypothetical protein [Rhizobium leguminosarum]
MPDDRNLQEVMMRERLLRAIDRRDPWNAVDLMDWLRFHFPEYLMRGDERRAAADFAEEIASELANDPAFPLVVRNLRDISRELSR